MKKPNTFFIVMIIGLSIVTSLKPKPSSANAFDEAAFKSLWQRTDALVQQGSVNRTWLWGPEAALSNTEPYVESPEGIRLVQYFDKSRMEITNPQAPRDQWFVTNGLIVQELVSGRVQVGDKTFVEYPTLTAIAVAGDLMSPKTPPTYSGFGRCEPHLAKGQRATKQLGQAIIALWEEDCTNGVDQTKATQYPETAIAAYDEVTGANIPAIFWDYFQQSGQIIEQGKVVTAKPLFDWLYVFGHPITESYWSRVMVGGVEQDVLIQLYERRVLTYTPANPAGWKVEMGNVGQHYYQWRYATLPPMTHVDCSMVETIDPSSQQAQTIKTQALQAIAKLPEQQAQAFEAVWAIDRAGTWLTLQAHVQGSERAIFVLEQTTDTTMTVQSVWGGSAGDAQTIRTYLAQQSPNAPAALFNCLAPYGFTKPPLR